jgi:4-amino-4-deoxychorismate lyase
MCKFIETIRLKDGQLQNISYHNARFNRTREKLLDIHEAWSLEEHIQIPRGIDKSTFKCRVTYSSAIEQVEFEPYMMRSVNRLKLVYTSSIDYEYKFKNRKNIQALLKEKGSADDIIIVKNGQITDTSYSNLVFYDGVSWFTPVAPLLKGTQRALLIDQGRIREAFITINDLPRYKKLRLINAMIGLDESPDLEISSILLP